MKKFFFLLAIVSLFVACDKDDDAVVDNSTVHEEGWSETPRHVEFGVAYHAAKSGSYGTEGDSSNLSILMGFHRNDQFAIWATDDGESAPSCFTSNDTVTRNVVGGKDALGADIYKYLIIDGIRKGGPDFYIAYPYSDVLTKSGSGSNIKFSGFNIPLEQSAPLGSMQSGVTVMCGTGHVGSSVFLKQCCALVAFRIDYQDTITDSINQCSFEAVRTDGNLYGEAELDFATQSLSGTGSGSPAKISFVLTSSGSLFKEGYYYLAVIPGTYKTAGVGAQTPGGLGCSYSSSSSTAYNLLAGHYYVVDVTCYPNRIKVKIGSEGAYKDRGTT